MGDAQTAGQQTEQIARALSAQEVLGRFQTTRDSLGRPPEDCRPRACAGVDAAQTLVTSGSSSMA